MRGSRVGSRRNHSSGANLIEERREVGAQITDLDGIAARRQIMLGAYQQPGPAVSRRSIPPKSNVTRVPLGS